MHRPDGERVERVLGVHVLFAKIDVLQWDWPTGISTRFAIDILCQGSLTEQYDTRNQSGRKLH